MKYVALFRGINVGGKNKVLMEDLRLLFNSLGFSNVKSYIQSGNVIFETSLKQNQLNKMISDAFLQTFGFSANLIVQNIDEWKKILDEQPFSKDEINQAISFDEKVTHQYFFFFDEEVSQSMIDKMEKEYDGPDKLFLGKQVLYFLCYPSIRLSKMAKIIDKHFPNATARNWKTIQKIYSLMK